VNTYEIRQGVLLIADDIVGGLAKIMLPAARTAAKQILGVLPIMHEVMGGHRSVRTHRRKHTTAQNKRAARTRRNVRARRSKRD
jgi:hypothetical protein